MRYKFGCKKPRINFQGNKYLSKYTDDKNIHVLLSTSEKIHENRLKNAEVACAKDLSIQFF